jgi:hypothetical protein
MRVTPREWNCNVIALSQWNRIAQWNHIADTGFCAAYTRAPKRNH